MKSRESRLGPLRSVPFRWMLAARTVLLLGNSAAPIALAFAVLDLTGSAIDLGLVVASRSVANVSVLVLGGVIADRLPRNLVLVGCTSAAAVSQGIVAALVLGGEATIPALIVLSIANGALAGLSLPATSSLVPQTVPPEDLRSANALVRLSMNGAAVVGASIGGLLIAVIGPGFGLAVDAAVFLLAALFFLGIRIAPAHKHAVAPERPRTMIADLRDGWEEFRSHRWLWPVVVHSAVVNASVVGAVAVLGPLVADQTFGRAAWGVIIASQTIGFIAGGLVALSWRPRRLLFAGVSAVTFTALPLFALAEGAGVWILVVGFFVAGAALEFFGVNWDQAVQQNVAKDKLARVYSYDAVGSFIAIPLGEVFVGPLASEFGTAPVLNVCGAVVVVVSALVLLVPAVRKLRASPAEVPVE